MATQDGGNTTGGLLVAIGIASDGRARAPSAVIVIDLPGVRHGLSTPFAIAGDPDGDMSSVSAAASPLNLGRGADHERLRSRWVTPTAPRCHWLRTRQLTSLRTLARRPSWSETDADDEDADSIDIAVGEEDDAKPGVIRPDDHGERREMEDEPERRWRPTSDRRAQARGRRLACTASQSPSRDLAINDRRRHRRGRSSRRPRTPMATRLRRTSGRALTRSRSRA